ncbi:hypothetical protein CRV24_000176 [Beauveria bassiana]|nr:hypothetical protein CRV24_000176 [Beauveria bassiana]KAH8721307.1 hypothetical protein HC256_001666 [Beauveria bassiana]
MPCCAPGVSSADITSADELQHAAIQQIQLEQMKQLREALRDIEVPTLKKDVLSELSIALGTQLNVDGVPNSLSEISSTFFAPCDWPLETLQFETRRARWAWSDWSRRSIDSAILLLVPESRAHWFYKSLLRLSRRASDLWDSYYSPGYIREATGFYLPSRDFYPEPSWTAYHTSYGKWVQFSPVASELPHASCLVVDSGTPEDDMILLSEAEQAAALVEFQLKDSGYTNHHTKPVLVATIMRNQTARLTQAYFDGKQNMLVLRQSRTLDLSGRLPSSDAWLLLRWIASQPIGETRYPANGAQERMFRDDPTNLASQIPV